MIPLSLRAETENPDFTLTLNTGRVRDQWHTMTRTGRVANLMSHISSPSIALHPRDAAVRGIAERGLARIQSPDAAVVMRAAIDEGVRPGDVFAPMHWTDQFSSSGPIDKLVHALTDPVSGQPDLKGTKVRVSALTEIWRGTLFRLSSGEPELSESVWWSKAQTRTGFAFEMSGWEPLEKEVHSEQVLRRLLKIPGEAELVSYSDPRKAMFRYAGLVQGRLAGCVFFGPPGRDFAGVEQAKSLLGSEITAAERISLLAGLEAGDALSASKIVCACFSISEAAISAAIVEKGFTSPAEIGTALKAGTNCGSCIPEIKKLLGASAVSPAASAPAV